MSTERERFEAWAGSITPAGSPKPVRNSEIAWYAWQARAALAQPAVPIQGDWRTAALAYLRASAEDRSRTYAGNPDMLRGVDLIKRLAEELEVMQQASPYGLDCIAQPEPVAKVYERADGSFGIHKLGELHGGMMLYAGHAQPVADQLRALAMDELYKFQQATGCDTADQLPKPEPVGYCPAYELERLASGHNAYIRPSKFGPGALDGDVPLYLHPAHR